MESFRGYAAFGPECGSCASASSSSSTLSLLITRAICAVSSSFSHWTRRWSQRRCR